MPSASGPHGSDSDSDVSMGEIDGFDEDEHDLPKVVAIEDTTKDVAEAFSPGQLRYLHSLKVQYVELRKEKRPEFALTVASKLIKHMQKHGLAKDEKAKGNVRKKVRLWFQQNCRQKKDTTLWTRAWTGRLVYYHKNPDVVKRRWIELRREKGEDIPDIPPDEDESGEQEEESLEEQDDESRVDGEGSAGGASPVRPPVGFFQQALSAAWKELSRAEQRQYERTALEWRLDGPNEEMQRILVGKKLHGISLQFAETIFKQMGVRVFMLVTYKNVEQATVCSTIDHNGKPNFGSRPFVKSFGKQFDETGIMGLWGAYSKETVVTKEEVIVDPKLVRRTGKPLLKLELNRYGEPRIPNPSNIPPGEQAHQYLPQLIRNIFIYNYARSSGREPNRTVPPWSEIVADLRTFISPEHLPDDLAKNFKEPSGIKVGPARSIILYWRKRQAEKKIPLNIHNYIDDSGQVVPREPREPVEGLEDLASDYYVSDEETAPSPKVIKSRSRKGKEKSQGDKDASRERDDLDVGASEMQPTPVSNPEETKVIQRRSKSALRRVMDSDDEESFDNAPLGSPFVTPPPNPAIPSPPTTLSDSTPIPSTSLAPSTRTLSDPLEPNLEAELAGLSEHVKKLVIEALHHQGLTDFQIVPPSDVPMQPDSAGPSTLPLKQSASPLLAVSEDTDSDMMAIKESDSPIPELPKSRRKGKAPVVPPGDSERVATRRRRTEEEVLLEMAAKAGAKSGPRTSKRSSKLRG